MERMPDWYICIGLMSGLMHVCVSDHLALEGTGTAWEMFEVPISTPVRDERRSEGHLVPARSVLD